MKQVYRNAIPIAQSTTDKYRVREHASNFGIAYFLILSCSIITTMFMLKFPYYLQGLLISLAISVGVYAYCLMDFTNEARDLLIEEYHKRQETITQEIIREQEDNEYQKTFLPTLKGHDKVAINVYLSDHQKEQIAYAAINAGKLTINFLDSIGVSRTRAEQLRNELARIGYAVFDSNSQLSFTTQGVKSLQRLVK